MTEAWEIYLENEFLNVRDLELAVLMLFCYKVGLPSDGFQRKPGESQLAVVWASASGYMHLTRLEMLTWGGLAPQPILGFQE